MKRSEFMKNYWRYYLLLEKHFEAIESYVEISKDNFKTFSFEFASQLQNIGSELDTVMKEICNFDQTARKKISDYCPIILRKYPTLDKQKVVVRGIEIIPFENWESRCASQSLDWWNAYNCIKHGRVQNYKEGNLGNVLSALSGLYILERFYLKEISDDEGTIDIPDPDSKLFRAIDWDNKWMPTSDIMFMKQAEIDL